jgi:hypothetical protein
LSIITTSGSDPALIEQLLEVLRLGYGRVPLDLDVGVRRLEFGEDRVPFFGEWLSRVVVLFGEHHRFRVAGAAGLLRTARRAACRQQADGGQAGRYQAQRCALSHLFQPFRALRNGATLR